MCGVIGLMGTNPGVKAATLIYLGLYALQHRGQESAGMAVGDGRQIQLHRGMGLVGEVFSLEKLETLRGHTGIGHVRYSTRGSPNPVNAQPFLGHTRNGLLALAHNGDLVNALPLRRRLQAEGAIFHTTTDSEVILHLLGRQGGETLEQSMAATVALLRGGFATVAMDLHQVVGVRDPWGIRPLCWGRGEDFLAVASESAALSSLGAEEIHEVEPGHMVIFEGGEVRVRSLNPAATPAPCVFEFIYFARPDSEMGGRNVYEVRKAIGRRLWEEHPVDADVVIPAPDSGISAALGFSEASGIPFEMGLIKNRYVGRTFIQPTQASRELGVRIKLNPIRKVIAGRRVVVIDDSIVRGTTSRKLVRLLRDAGAREVHMYVASPPFRFPCHYGIDIDSPAELVAASRSIEEVRQYIGADSLYYLSHEGLAKAIGVPAERLCLACMTGCYPAGVPDSRDADKHALEGEQR